MSLRTLKINKIPKTYSLVLMKNSREKVAELKDIEITSVKSNHEDTSEISFNIPFYVTDEITMETMKNPLYDTVRENMMVQVNGDDIFSIKKIEETENFDGEIQKTVECYSCEINLGKLPIIVTEKVRQLMEDDVETGEGVLNLVSEVCSWKPNYVDEKARTENKNGIRANKYRYFETGETDVLNFLKDTVTKAYDCLVIFDTNNKTYDVFDRKSYGSKLPITLSKENYVNNFKKSSDGTQLITRLRARGKDNLVFTNFNPLGTDYIEDITPYRNETYMSKALLEALDRYDNNAIKYHDNWVKLRNLLSVKQKELLQIERKCKEWQSKLKTFKSEQNAFIKEKSKSPKGNAIVESNMVNVAEKIDDCSVTHGQYQSQFDAKKQEINSIKSQMKDIQKQYDKKTCKDSQGLIFNEELLAEYETFILVDSYTNEVCLDEDTLYEETKRELKDRNTPTIDFDISVEDFLTSLDFGLEEFEKIEYEIKVGDFIEVYSEKLSEKRWVRLISYEHSPSGNSLSLQFSTKDSPIDGLGSLGSALEQMHKTAQKVDINKYYWDLSKDTSDWVKDFRTKSLDLVAQQIKSKTTRNKVDISELGIYLSDMGNEQEQLAMTNNIIAMTLDGWRTCEVAITPRWINGKLICAESIACEQLDVVARKKLEQGGEALIEVEANSERFRVKLENTQKHLEGQILLNSERFQTDLRDTKNDIHSQILQTANSIKATVEDVRTKANSLIEQKSDVIRAMVRDNQDVNNQKFSEIKQTANSISLTVNGVARSLNNKVSKGNIISSINMEDGRIKINADKIEMNGIITASDLSTIGKTQICGSNIDTSDIKCGNIKTANLSSKGQVWFYQGVNVSGDMQINKYDSGKGGGLYVCGDFGVGGKKSRVIDTKKYGKICMNAIESGYCLFEDSGRCRTLNGKARVYISKKFLVTVEGDYDIILSPYGLSDIRVVNRQKNYFDVVLKNGEDIEFYWIVRATQKDYLGVRLEEWENVK